MTEEVTAKKQAHESLQKLLEAQQKSLSVQRQQQAFDVWAGVTHADGLGEVELAEVKDKE